MVLNGRRLPSDALLESLVGPEALLGDLNPQEKDYLKLLARLERAKRRGQDPAPVLERIRKLGNGQASLQIFPLSNHLVLRDWYVLVVRELITMPGFRETGKWISEKLGRRISPAQARRAIEVLIGAGALAREEGTNRLISVAGYGESSQDVPSVSIRAHHHGMIEQAARALEEQPVTRRQFNALTFRINPARLGEIKKRMETLVRELHTEFEDVSSTHIYQFNMQLFEHTDSAKKGDSDAVH